MSFITSLNHSLAVNTFWDPLIIIRTLILKMLPWISVENPRWLIKIIVSLTHIGAYFKTKIQYSIKKRIIFKKVKNITLHKLIKKAIFKTYLSNTIGKKEEHSINNDNWKIHVNHFNDKLHFWEILREGRTMEKYFFSETSNGTGFIKV